VPVTNPNDAWYGAGCTIAGGGGRATGAITPSPYSCPVRILAHLDLDAFYAAVEELEQPELRRRPLVVGGDPHGRGVVATANYVARRYGIRSAMSAAEALRRCPQAVFVRPRHGLYRQYSQTVWTAVQEVVPRVERTGLDEGYLDLSSAIGSDFARARGVAEAVQTAVRAAASLTCSLGVSTAKVVCKVASERRKPGGITVVPPGSEGRFLAPYPVRALPGVGPRAEARLQTAGVETVGTLAGLSDADLRAILPGSVGRLLRDRARGHDDRDLELDVEQVSISVEETFERDLADREALHAELRRMSVEVGGHLRRKGLAARTVTAKLRYADFSIRSRSTTLPAAIDDDATIAELACALLDRGLRDRPGALRLVGVGVSGLSDHRQLTLVG
jgi:DNA polymerase IV